MSDDSSSKQQFSKRAKSERLRRSCVTYRVEKKGPKAAMRRRSQNAVALLAKWPLIDLRYCVTVALITPLVRISPLYDRRLQEINRGTRILFTQLGWHRSPLWQQGH